jgi:membrane protein DedA with SNARE-associated domain
LPTLETLMQFIQTDGLWVLAPMALLEGPIVTVIAAYLAQLGYMNLLAVYLICVAADLVGDAMLYGIGRYGASALPRQVTRRLGLTETWQAALTGHFASQGDMALLFGKWTHAAGMPFLIAAGMARMNFLRFIGVNLLGTLPKTLVFLVIGYFLGAGYQVIDHYVLISSQVMLGAAIVIASGYFLQKRSRT